MRLFDKGPYRIVLPTLALLLAASCAGEPPSEGLPVAPREESNGGESRPVPDESDSVPVDLATVVREDVTEVFRLTGASELWDEYLISSEIPGKVVAIHSDEGKWTKKGQLLVELDRERREIELEMRKAELARAQTDREFSQKSLQRGRTLRQRGAMSEAEVDQLDQAAQLAESAVRLAEIAIRSMEDELKDTRIYSPVSGQVSIRHVSLGENVTPAGTLFTIIEYDPIKVVTEVSEIDFFSLDRNAPVSLTFDALPDKRFRGTIHRVDAVANSQSGAFQVEVLVANPGHRLRAGMVARLEMQGPRYRQALLAPLDAVVEADGQTYVFAVSEGTAQRRSIRIVKRMGDRAILSGALQAGDQLVTRGNVNLTDGAPVTTLDR